MTPQGRLALLHSFRLSLEALIAEEEAETLKSQPIVDPAACPHCGAPEEHVQDTSTLDGTKRRLCKACKVEW